MGRLLPVLARRRQGFMYPFGWARHPTCPQAPLNLPNRTETGNALHLTFWLVLTYRFHHQRCLNI